MNFGFIAVLVSYISRIVSGTYYRVYDMPYTKSSVLDFFNEKNSKLLIKFSKMLSYYTATAEARLSATSFLGTLF